MIRAAGVQRQAGLATAVGPCSGRTATQGARTFPGGPVVTAGPAPAANRRVQSPPADRPGSRHCRMLSRTAGRAGSPVCTRSTSDAPAPCMTPTTPARRRGPETGRGRPALLRVTNDPRRGRIGPALSR